MQENSDSRPLEGEGAHSSQKRQVREEASDSSLEEEGREKEGAESQGEGASSSTDLSPLVEREGSGAEENSGERVEEELRTALETGEQGKELILEGEGREEFSVKELREVASDFSEGIGWGGRRSYFQLLEVDPQRVYGFFELVPCLRRELQESGRWLVVQIWSKGGEKKILEFPVEEEEEFLVHLPKDDLCIYGILGWWERGEFCEVARSGELRMGKRHRTWGEEVRWVRSSLVWREGGEEEADSGERSSSGLERKKEAVLVEELGRKGGDLVGEDFVQERRFFIPLGIYK